MSLYLQSLKYEDASTDPYTVSLPAPLNTASVVLQGFKVSFGSGTATYVEDVQAEITNVSAVPGEKQVTFSLKYDITSNSDIGNSGNTLTVLVIADLQGAGSYGPTEQIVVKR